MNIKDEQFKNFIKYTDHGTAFYSPEAVALRFAEILEHLIKGTANTDQRSLWDSVPQADGETTQRLDVIKDFSIRSASILRNGQWQVDSNGGQVGVVTEVREITKRDGRKAVQVEFVFFNHTNRYSAKKRKLEFIKG